MAQLLVNDLGLLVAAWAPDANNYRAAVEAMDQRNAVGRAFNGMTVLAGYEIPLRRIGAGLFPAEREFPAVAVQRHLRRRQPLRLRRRAGGLLPTRASTTCSPASIRRWPPRSHAAFERADAALVPLDAPPYDRFLAPPPGSPERAEAEAAVRALTDLGRELRQAGNRLGVLVVVPGL